MASDVNGNGYVFGETPTPNVPFWDNSMNFSDITATAEIDNTSGQPSVELEVTKNNVGVGNLNFKFHGLKGQSGGSGKMEAAATVDNNVGTPSVDVVKTYIDEETTRFTFNFHNLKGANGANGTNGTNGEDGTTPVISATATVDNLSSNTPTCTVTKSGTDAAPTFNFAFSGIKGASGGGGGDVDLSVIPDLDAAILANLFSNYTKGTPSSLDFTKKQLFDITSAVVNNSITVEDIYNTGEITLNGTFDVSRDGGETYSEETLNNLSLTFISPESSVSLSLNTHTATVQANGNIGIYKPYNSGISTLTCNQNILQYSLQGSSSTTAIFNAEYWDESSTDYVSIKIKMGVAINKSNQRVAATKNIYNSNTFNSIFTISGASMPIDLEDSIYLTDKNGNALNLSNLHNYCEIEIALSLEAIPITLTSLPNLVNLSRSTGLTQAALLDYFADAYDVTLPS